MYIISKLYFIILSSQAFICFKSPSPTIRRRTVYMPPCYVTLVTLTNVSGIHLQHLLYADVAGATCLLLVDLRAVHTRFVFLLSYRTTEQYILAQKTHVIVARVFCSSSLLSQSTGRLYHTHIYIYMICYILLCVCKI